MVLYSVVLWSVDGCRFATSGNTRHVTQVLLHGDKGIASYRWHRVSYCVEMQGHPVSMVVIIIGMVIS